MNVGQNPVETQIVLIAPVHVFYDAGVCSTSIILWRLFTNLEDGVATLQVLDGDEQRAEETQREGFLHCFLYYGTFVKLSACDQ